MKNFLMLTLTIPLMLFSACGGSNDTAKGSDQEILDEVNGDLNDGRSARFKRNPIRVYVKNIDDGKEQVRKWDEATDGVIGFEFVNDDDDADMIVRYGVQAPLVCGVTYYPEIGRDGEIKQSDIELDPKTLFSDSIPFIGGCKQTVAHEVGHALGFFGHTDDGGLMDPDGGNGRFTEQVKRIMKTLYSYPPDTRIDDMDFSR